MAFRSQLLVAAITVFSILGVSDRVLAQGIDQAEARWFEADFDGARRLFEAVLGSAQLSTTEAVAAHRYLAALDDLRGDARRAQLHAEAALALDPSANAPDGAPRGTAALFAAARSRLGGRRASLSIASVPDLVSNGRRTVEVRVEAAPEGLVPVLHLRCGELERTARGSSLVVEVDAGADVDCTAEARTEGGAALLRAERGFGPSGRSSTATGTARATADDRTVRRRRVGAITGASAAAVAAVLVGVLVHRSAEDARFGGTTVVGW